MQYSPKGFQDIVSGAKMAPAELQSPLNFADGGLVYDGQSQINDMMASPSGFSGMSNQLNMATGGMVQSEELAMAHGGAVGGRMASTMKSEFSKRGLDFDKYMAKRLAAKGHNGDTMLAHINPSEAQMLKQAGGSGKINPDTV